MGEYAESRSLTLRLYALFKKPLVIILLMGLLIRIVLIPLATYNYDIPFWATAIQHVQSDSGLYELGGYHYTPVWGYILGFLGMIANFLFGISSYGTMADALLPSSVADWDFYGIIVASPEFSIFIKAVMTVFDVLCGYLIYTIVRKFGYDKKKATLAFGLWFLCPLVIYTSAVHGTFDSISILFLLLTLLMMMDRRYFLAGALFSLASFTKYFPVYLIFILFIYVLKTNKGRGAKIKASVLTIVGFLTATFMILLPQILDGTISDVFGFVSDRVAFIDITIDSLWSLIISVGFFLVLLLQLIIFTLLIIIAWKTHKMDDKTFKDNFMFMVFLSSIIIFLWTPAPTYLMVTLPFLIYVVVTAETSARRRYVIPLVLMSITATIYAIGMHNFSIFFQDSIYHGLISADTILNGIAWLDVDIIPGVTRNSLMNLLFGIMETMAIYSVFVIYIYNYKLEKVAKGVHG